MSLNTVIGGNRLRWDGKKNPFYEIYYLKLANGKEGWSFWARYTLLIPKGEREKAQASLWGIFARLTPEPSFIGLKTTHLLSHLDPFHSERFIELKDNFLSIDAAQGLLSDSDHQINWQFQFEDPTRSACLYPHRFLYSSPLPKTKFLEPRLSTYVSGSLKVDHQVLRLDKHRAHQAHIWGTEYAKRWAWGNCNEFEEDPTAVFEGLTAQIALGPLTSPPMVLFYFIFEGEEYRGNRFLQWFSNKSEFHLNEWKFTVICRDTKFDGLIKRDVSQIVGVEYQGPRGEKRYCHNTMMADMELKIFKKEKKEWNFYKTLTSRRTCAFETVEPNPDPHVKFVL